MANGTVSENATDQDTEDSDNNSLVPARAPVSTPISILISSLVKNLCHAYASDPEDVQAMYNLICKNLFKIHMIDESYGMAEFEGVRSEYQKAFHHLLQSAGHADSVALRPVFPTTDLNSHYGREFDEVEFIAGGGFGRVFRVKHKLDGTDYAIKKIPIRAEGIAAVRSYLTEVKTFASVNHANIVPYKGAWLELGAPFSDTTPVDEDSTSSLAEVKTHLDDDYIYCENTVHSFSESKREDSSDFQIDFEHSANDNNPEKLKGRGQKRSSLSEGHNAICKLDMKEIREIRIQQKAQLKWATLYIQMALCQTTLKQWLERRNDAETHVDGALVLIGGRMRSETIYEVLSHLLKGLQYIHSKGIVHHDIKPSNIFMQVDNGKLSVLLGDFGLACPLQNARHSLAFGTRLYAAPEQLEGKCDSKSDMYSLGIVLYELVERFRTDMERAEYITNLRKGLLPPHIRVQQPQLSPIISQLMSRSPRDRPDASALLETISANLEPESVRELKYKLAERDEEISRLKEMLKSAGVNS